MQILNKITLKKGPKARESMRSDAYRRTYVPLNNEYHNQCFIQLYLSRQQIFGSNKKSETFWLEDWIDATIISIQRESVSTHTHQVQVEFYGCPHYFGKE